MITEIVYTNEQHNYSYLTLQIDNEYTLIVLQGDKAYLVNPNNKELDLVLTLYSHEVLEVILTDNLEKKFAERNWCFKTYKLIEKIWEIREFTLE